MRTNLIMWERENGYKSKYVAEKLGITAGYWSLVKTGGKTPSIKLLDKFYEVFGETKGAEDIYHLFKLVNMSKN